MHAVTVVGASKLDGKEQKKRSEGQHPSGVHSAPFMQVIQPDNPQSSLYVRFPAGPLWFSRDYWGRGVGRDWIYRHECVVVHKLSII